MLDQIEQLAHLSVARGCGFAALGIVTVFIGMSGEMEIAFKSAGYLTLLACAVLLLKAALVQRQNYRTTEVWVMLKPAERPDKAVAQQLISTVLREAYLTFAWHAAMVSAMFLVCGLAVGLVQR